jgi:DNA-binding transcriptional MocR family regulator
MKRFGRLPAVKHFDKDGIVVFLCAEAGGKVKNKYDLDRHIAKIVNAYRKKRDVMIKAM